MPKVSIIIPTYNVEPYLEEAMESVTRQTLKDIEIICINDGSTDGSLDILKRYAAKDDRIILVDKENEGYGVGMNIGLDRASGEYIGILEPDDYVANTMFEDLYRVAAENDLDFVKADFYRFKRNTENGNMELEYFHLSDDPADYNKVFDPSHTPESIRFVMNTWSGIYKKEFLDRYQIRHNTTPGASFQDNGFYFQTFVFGERAMILDRPYYRNRRDNPNSSVHNRGKVYAMNVEYDYIQGILLEHPEIWNRFKYMYWRKRFSNSVTTLKRIGDEYKREYVEQMHREFKRADMLGEIDRSAFEDTQWSELQFLLKDPEGYYDQRAFLQKLSADEELRRIKNSKSYRLAEAIAKIPRKIRKSGNTK